MSDNGVTVPPWLLRVGQCICVLFLLACLGLFLYGGTQEGRVTILLAALTGVLSAGWGLLAIPLLAPMLLLDASKIHILVVIEALVVGIFLGRVLRWGRKGPNVRREWGFWPYWLVGLGLLVLAAGWVGLLNLIFMEYPGGRPDNPFFYALWLPFYFAATEPYWSLKVLWNWLTGLALAVVAARIVTPLFAARWMKIAGVALVLISLLSLLTLTGWFTFSDIRGDNLDPFHQGRLQGPAGHSGWFAQWIVFAWAGIALFWQPGRRKLQIALGVVLALVLVVLILTGARAALLAVVVAAAVAGGRIWGGKGWSPRLLLLIPGGLVAIFLAGLLVEGSIGYRLTNLLRFQDRANYYVSSWHLIHDAPMGVGMGMHARAYQSRFTEFWQWYQKDHVTAHSTWLHTLVEGSPFLPLMLCVGIIGLIRGYRRAAPWMEMDTRRTTVALATGLLGLFVISFMQYIFYIRVVEILCWVTGGMMVGLYRLPNHHDPENPPDDDLPVASWGGPRLLLASGVASAIVISMTAFTFDPGEAWREPEGNRKTGISLWTGAKWRTAIPPGTSGITLSLHRKGTPCEVVIQVSGERRFEYRLEPDEWKYVEIPLEPGRRTRGLDPIRWLRIETTPIWYPTDFIEDSVDGRALGIYIYELKMLPPEGFGGNP